MSVFISVDVTDLLRRSDHFMIPAKIIEKHESTVKIHTFQNKISHNRLHKGKCALVLLEFIIQVPDKGIARKKIGVALPLIEHLIPSLRLADGIQHITVTLAVNRLLKGLNGKTEIDLIGSYIFPKGRQIRGLDAVQKHKKG